MPTLPLIAPTLPGSGDLPVASSDDVLAVMPARYRNPPEAPVRDALVATLSAIMFAWQERAGYAAAQSDPGRAVENYLDGVLNDHGVIRAGVTELDDAFRARGIQVPELVTRQAIVDAINSVLDRYTTVRAQVFETIADGWFVEDGTASWHSFIDAGPSYPDRLYVDDEAPNDGVSIDQSDPGGAWPIADMLGRHFVVRAPLVQAPTDTHFFTLDGSSDVDPDDQFGFVGDGSDTSGSETSGDIGALFSGDTITVEQIYQAVINAVERVRGHGIRWTLATDPALT